MRKIIHVDMDCFFAAVEELDHPELRGKPVIVGGSPHGRGVVSTANYEARKFGVHSAMPTAQAYRLCPQGVFVKSHFKRYQEISKVIREIFHEVTDLVEPLSLDEAFLDVTENKWQEPSAGRIAMKIRAEIQARTGLTASAGVAPLKFVAKIASDLKKPNGLVIVPPQEVDAFVRGLKVGQLWGVGKVTREKLHERGFFTVADLRRISEHEMARWFGKFGRSIHRQAHGIDDRGVTSERIRKSHGSERTLSKDLLDRAELSKILREESESVGASLRRTESRGRTITLKLRYRGFDTITRSRTLDHGTNDGQEIFQTAQELLLERTEVGHRPARLIGVSVSGLVFSDDWEQLSFGWR